MRVSIQFTSSILALAQFATTAPLSRQQLFATNVCVAALDQDPAGRAASVEQRSQGFIYGPSLIGETTPFPAGALGNARRAQDLALWEKDRDFISVAIAKDVAALKASLAAKAAAGGAIRTLDQYAAALYSNQWINSNPRGVAPGVLANYTQDLFFSMERLTSNPWALKLVTGDIPFTVEYWIVRKLTGTTLEGLRSQKKLFAVDYRNHASLAKSQLHPARFSAACSALFFIHPKSGDFLPLAIKTNAGANLTYTPKDSPNDWLLAKMLFNVNDMFEMQMSHLARSHALPEGVHQAALHTMSEKHPVMMMLERFMYKAYAARVVGEASLFNPGGNWDQLFSTSNVGARDCVTNGWSTYGAFEATYLDKDLYARGLLNESGEHPFKDFTWYDDATAIRNAFMKFFTTFIDSYYARDSDVYNDFEVRNWFAEVRGAARVADFPTQATKQTLVEVLTHFAYLVTVAHHSLNGVTPADISTVVPLHIPALFAPLPEQKGITNLMPFLPKPEQAIHFISIVHAFNRPNYVSQYSTLKDVFADVRMLGQFNMQVWEAAIHFVLTMAAQSEKIQARGFDECGLSEGAPYIFRSLDPDYIPFFSAI